MAEPTHNQAVARPPANPAASAHAHHKAHKPIEWGKIVKGAITIMAIAVAAVAAYVVLGGIGLGIYQAATGTAVAGSGATLGLGGFLGQIGSYIAGFSQAAWTSLFGVHSAVAAGTAGAATIGVGGVMAFEHATHSQAGVLGGHDMTHMHGHASKMGSHVAEDSGHYYHRRRAQTARPGGGTWCEQVGRRNGSYSQQVISEQAIAALAEPKRG